MVSLYRFIWMLFHRYFLSSSLLLVESTSGAALAGPSSSSLLVLSFEVVKNAQPRDKEAAAAGSHFLRRPGTPFGMIRDSFLYSDQVERRNSRTMQEEERRSGTLFAHHAKSR
jgi:hypothetical protein